VQVVERSPAGPGFVPQPKRRVVGQAAIDELLDAFAELRRPLQARDLCTALDRPITAKNTKSTQPKLKRLLNLGILVETEPGLFTQPSP
jgi:hypothetical protein